MYNKGGTVADNPQDSFDLMLLNFTKLLGMNVDEIFEQDYMFLMKLLLAEARAHVTKRRAEWQRRAAQR